MIKRIIPIMAALSLLPCYEITTSAEEVEYPLSNTDAVVYSVGLICRYYVSLSGSGNSLLLSGKTNCIETMKSVGLKEIVIQRSSNNSNWSNYSNLSDMLYSDLGSFSTINSNIATVPSGYYYRITCKHYAKEYGLFGKSESLQNVSNSVYIP